LTKTAAPLGAVTNSNAKEWINYFDESRVSQNIKSPDTKLMNLPDLLKAVRKCGSAGGSTISNLVEMSDIELVWLSRIHFEIRNQFVHFAPQAWSIGISGGPQIGRIIARIIKDIHDCGWAFRHLNQSKKDAMVIDLISSH
jgi:hypothetical protein